MRSKEQQKNNFGRTLPKLTIIQHSFVPTSPTPIIESTVQSLIESRNKGFKLAYHFAEMQLANKAKRLRRQQKQIKNKKNRHHISYYDRAMVKIQKQSTTSHQMFNQITSQKPKYIDMTNPETFSIIENFFEGTEKKYQKQQRNFRGLVNKSVDTNLLSFRHHHNKLTDKSTQLTSLEFSNPLKSAIVNKTNLLQKRAYKKPQKLFYRVYFGKGNNSELVKQILLARKLWVETVQHDTIFNLRWEQSTQKSWYQRINFDRYKQTVNHFQMHQSVSTKSGLLENLTKYCQRRGIDSFTVIPMTFTLNWSRPKFLQEQLKRFMFFYYQNHPTEKNNKIQKEYIQMVKIISDSDIKLSNFCFEKSKLSGLGCLSDIYHSNDKQYIWMLKPSGLNRGRGIKMWSSIQQLTQLLVKSKDNREYQDSYVLQKYIQKPLLINSRKFDIRVWVLLDCKGALYFFEQGYIRTSCQEFKLDNIKDIYIHLTNNAIQINSDKYGQFEDGNQLSFSQFDQYVPHLAPFKQNILPILKDMVGLTMQSVKKKIFPKNELVNNKCSFEIFGFDFILDETGKPWVIEVNTNPCLETSSKLLEKYIPRLLDDAFKLVLDPIYPGSKSTMSYPVEGYENNENMWKQLQYNEKQLIQIFSKDKSTLSSPTKLKKQSSLTE